MTKKIKLVLSGSGTLYPVHVGAVIKLAELGYEVEEVCGTSGGAIVAAAIATGYKLNDELIQMVKKTLPGKNDLVDYSLWSLITKWGFIKGDKIEAALNNYLPKSFKETKIPLHIVTTNLERQAPRVFSTSTDPDMSIAKAIRASISIPGVFTPIKIDDELYVDGGVTANYALGVFGLGEDVIGLRFGHATTKVGCAVTGKRQIKTVSDYINANIDAMIEANNREHVEDAIYAKTIFLKSSHSSLKFSMTEADVDRMVEEGYSSVEKGLHKLVL